MIVLIGKLRNYRLIKKIQLELTYFRERKKKMKMSNNRLLQELKKVDYFLKENLNRNIAFKKLYEKENNDKIDDDDLVILNGRNIFSIIPKDAIEYLMEKGDFNKHIFNPEDDSIKIGNYFELLKVINYLINILEFDLTKAAIIG